MKPRHAYPTPRRRWPVLAAAGVLLTSGGIGAVATLPAQADEHETPEPEPQATVYAEAGPGCGGVTVGVLGSFLEWYRADLDAATANPTWVRQAPMDREEFSTFQLVDSPFVQYRVIWATGEDASPVIEVEPCPTSTPTPSGTPSSTPTAAPTASGTPTPTATPEPTDAATGSPEPPADKTATGGLAKTGV